MQQAFIQTLYYTQRKKNDNDFIMVNGAIDFSMIVQHFCTEFFFFFKVTKTGDDLEGILVANKFNAWEMVGKKTLNPRQH